MSGFRVLFVLWLLGCLIPRGLAVTLLEPAEGRKQARELVGKLLSLQPDGNSTNYGVLKIIPKDRSKRSEVPVKFIVLVTETNWQNIYETMPTSSVTPVTKLIVTHDATNPNQYDLIHSETNLWNSLKTEMSGQPLRDETTIPFAGSDFSIGDLGLHFLHWPDQRILKKEIKRSCGCSVLESLNPEKNSRGYSRVVSWIDNDSGGIVQAEAYDTQGKLLKEFLPKSVTKVNGQWQVDEIEMRNDQTGSRTLISFDLSH